MEKGQRTPWSTKETLNRRRNNLPDSSELEEIGKHPDPYTLALNILLVHVCLLWKAYLLKIKGWMVHLLKFRSTGRGFQTFS